MKVEPDLSNKNNAHKTVPQMFQKSTRKPTISERLPDDSTCGLEESLTRRLYKHLSSEKMFFHWLTSDLFRPQAVGNAASPAVS